MNAGKPIQHTFYTKFGMASITAIPGQGTSVSLAYFYVLVSSEVHIKPDRMVMRFLERIIGRKPREGEAIILLTEAVKELKEEYPHLTPRKLDNIIWSHERFTRGPGL